MNLRNPITSRVFWIMCMCKKATHCVVYYHVELCRLPSNKLFSWKSILDVVVEMPLTSSVWQSMPLKMDVTRRPRCQCRSLELSDVWFLCGSVIMRSTAPVQRHVAWTGNVYHHLDALFVIVPMDVLDWAHGPEFALLAVICLCTTTASRFYRFLARFSGKIIMTPSVY